MEEYSFLKTVKVIDLKKMERVLSRLKQHSPSLTPNKLIKNTPSSTPKKMIKHNIQYKNKLRVKT